MTTLAPPRIIDVLSPVELLYLLSTAEEEEWTTLNATAAELANLVDKNILRVEGQSLPWTENGQALITLAKALRPVVMERSIDLKEFRGDVPVSGTEVEYAGSLDGMLGTDPSPVQEGDAVGLTGSVHLDTYRWPKGRPVPENLISQGYVRQIGDDSFLTDKGSAVVTLSGVPYEIALITFEPHYKPIISEREAEQIIGLRGYDVRYIRAMADGTKGKSPRRLILGAIDFTNFDGVMTSQDIFGPRRSSQSNIRGTNSTPTDNYYRALDELGELRQELTYAKQRGGLDSRMTAMSYAFPSQGIDDMFLNYAANLQAIQDGVMKGQTIYLGVMSGIGGLALAAIAINHFI